MKITVTSDHGEIMQEVEDIKILCSVLLGAETGAGFIMCSERLRNEAQPHVANNFMTGALKEIIRQSLKFCAQDTKSLENDMKMELLSKFTDELDSLMTKIIAMREKEETEVTH